MKDPFCMEIMEELIACERRKEKKREGVRKRKEAEAGQKRVEADEGKQASLDQLG